MNPRLGDHPLAAKPLLTAGFLLLLTVLVLLGMGREPWGTAEHPGWWTPEVHSRLTSQRLADPYSFTHVTHGLGLWVLGWLLRDRLDAGTRFVAAVALEGGWEVLENTPFVIERFREATIAQGYYGDSVLNSTGDVLFMAVGYLAATGLSVPMVVLLMVTLEVLLVFLIRDSMVLNVLMLLYPMESLRAWQLQSAGVLRGVFVVLGRRGAGDPGPREGG